MTHQWDEFSKSLAEPLPRRESLRRLGAVLAGAVLAPLGLETAWAAGRDACKAFCNGCPKSQRTQCLDACRACNSDPSRLCGTCGAYACCGNGAACCGGSCADLANDVNNCGGCGNVCEPPGPYEEVACVSGQCEYWCTEGAVRCNGTCTLLDWDPDNCGACGHVCGGDTPYCNWGVCSECPPGLTLCGGTCVDLATDSSNCGACGNVCGEATPYCSQGVCTDCAWGAICDGRCVDLMWDSSNCGACGNVCPEQFACAWGVCEGICYDCY